MVNIIFLFATKDKPPDLASTTTLVSVASFQSGDPSGEWQRGASWPANDGTHSGGRRLFLRSNDFYDYSPPLSSDISQPPNQASSSSGSGSGSSSRAPIQSSGLLVGARAVSSVESTSGRQAEEVNDKRKQVGSVGGGSAASGPGSTYGRAASGAQLFASGSSRAASLMRQTIEAQSLPLTERAPGWSLQSKSELGTVSAEQAEKHEIFGANEIKSQRASASSTKTTTKTTTTLTSTQVDNDNYNRGDKDTEASSSSSASFAAGNEAGASVRFNQRVSDNLVDENSARVKDAEAKEGHEFDANDTNKADSSSSSSLASDAVNEIVTPGASATISIRVKSSKNHVLVRVDDSPIYESGTDYQSETKPMSERRRGRQRRQQQQQNQLSMASVSSSQPGARHRRQRRGWPGRHESRHQSISGGGGSQADGWTVAAVGLQVKNRTGASENAIKKQDDQQQQQQREQSERELAEASRGIHVLVLNQYDGSLMSRRVFDTYTPQQDDELQLYLNQIQDGRVLVFAVKDEASFRMLRGSAARKLLRRLGSHHIGSLGWRDMWAMVTVKRLDNLLETNAQIGERIIPTGPIGEGKCLAEAISNSASFSSWGEPVEIEANFQLKAPSNAERQQLDCFADNNEQTRRRRRDFCSRIEGYGRVCDCRHPSQIEFEPRAPQDLVGGPWQLGRVPIVVIASNRPYYLYRMLKSLLQADGVNASLVTVFIDGYYEEPAQVCKLFNLRYIQHKPTGSRSARISNHYKTSLAFTFRRLFGADEPPPTHAIIFEEDLDVAPDALLYFNQTLSLLKTDPSLYCVSAWNDQGYEHSVGDLRQLYRIETMPGLGWMLSRELFIGELEPAWPSASQQHDWDMWIRTRPVRKGRECLIPDVSRTYHFGSSGTNINSYFQRQYFSKHAFSAHHLLRDLAHGPRRKLAPPLTTGGGQFKDLDKMDKTNYELMIERLLREEAEFVVGQQIPRGDQSSLNTTESGASDRQLRQYKFLCSLANLTHYHLDEELNRSQDDDDVNNTIVKLNTNSSQKLTNSIGVGRSDIDSIATNNKSTSMTSTTTTTSTIKVIFIKMIDREDYGNWLRLAKCWHLWDLDARGQHQSAWRLYLNGRPTLVIGTPASPYSKFKPNDLVPYDFI